jgi:hypothetical protein
MVKGGSMNISQTLLNYKPKSKLFSRGDAWRRALEWVRRQNAGA